MNHKHILLVGRSRDLHAKIKPLGLKATLMIETAKLSDEPLSPVYERVVSLPQGANDSEWITWAKAIHQIQPVTAIGAFTETREKVALAIANAIGLPFHDASIIELMHEKDMMRAKLHDIGLDDTNFARLAKDSPIGVIEETACKMGFPLVLKPVNARGSLGVRILNSKIDLHPAIETLRQVAPKCDLVLEQLLDGREFSIEAFSESGRHKIAAVTEKFKDSFTSIETGQLIPARISTHEYEEICIFVKKLLNSLNVTHGPSHTEVFLTKQGVRLVESHTRLGGDRISKLIELVSGADLEELWIRQTAGESVIDKVPQIAPVSDKCATVQYSFLRKAGIIRRIETDTSELSADPRIVELNPLLQTGQEGTPNPIDSFSRSAEAIATGTSPEDAIAAAQSALQRIKYHLEPK